VSGNTSIEWTDATWNPVRGCSRVSEGCRHCYAEQVAARFSGPGMPYEGLAKRVGGEARWTGKVRLIPEHLNDPLRWKKPRRVFVNSMSDLFHEGLSFDEIAAVFSVMAMAEQHTFQVLTKRPERALEFFCAASTRWPLPNVWLGVSVEDQATADERIPLLLQTPVAVRFVSYEPALGPVDFTRIALGVKRTNGYGDRWIEWDALSGSEWQHYKPTRPESRDGKEHHAIICTNHPRLDWIIVGGESGRGARPFDLRWARNTAEQCRAAGVACFVKQLGASPFSPVDMITHRGNTERMPLGFSRYLNDSKGGDWLEWPEDLRVRQYPEAP
jgi:protein gp37